MKIPKNHKNSSYAIKRDSPSQPVGGTIVNSGNNEDNQLK